MALHDADPKTYSFVKLPRAVYAHSYWVREGRKMSKSLGNFVEIETLRAYADKYSLDAVRWYLLTQGPLGSTDADFSHAKFVEIYNANLANGLGNCASRVANMIGKYFAGQVPAPAGPITNEVESFAAGIAERYLALADELNLDAALALGTGLISKVDQFINDTQPFKLAKTIEQNPAARDRLGQILYICAEAIRIATVLLSPAIPGKAAHLFKAWGLPALDTSIGAAHAPLTELARFAAHHRRADASEPRTPLCVDVCPVDCIHPTKAEADFATADQLYIDPDTCIDCGLCVDECPVKAIFPQEDLAPAEWNKYIQINIDYYKKK
jgi:methionyl-tRNA synthetase/NAD-dependent dihydropyrimidine dehydrogenase PreA subunit